MFGKRILPVVAVLALGTFAACGGESDEGFETTDTEIITQPTTETVEVEVPATDSLMVERTVETDVNVDVDTTQIE